MRKVLKNDKGSVGRWVLIIIIVAAALFGYRYFKTTPRYTLIQFKKSVLFSDAETTRQFIDLDKVGPGLPDSFTNKESDEAIKKRIISELNSPSEKPFFKVVKEWSVIMTPITVLENQVVAYATPIEGTKVTLEKIKEDQWVITALEISE
ncbi:MAG: hypothetical protein M0P30_11380 [Syntrophorhabdaceae bacterium]|nr:hypothetical protein [Syntrophorhabdaceae bacterium]